MFRSFIINWSCLTIVKTWNFLWGRISDMETIICKSCCFCCCCFCCCCCCRRRRCWRQYNKLKYSYLNCALFLIHSNFSKLWFFCCVCNIFCITGITSPLFPATSNLMFLFFYFFIFFTNWVTKFTSAYMLQVESHNSAAKQRRQLVRPHSSASVNLPSP